jgi:hypothetical protein
MSNTFYNELKSFTNFSEFTKLTYYRPLPENWMVVITDIVDSSNAIETGMYQAVNAVSAASIVAILNALPDISVPYIFGGDGVTVCVPEKNYQDVAPALIAAKKMALESFQLELRIGAVPMRAIQEQGYKVLIGKYQANEHFQQAMFQGNGIPYAEKLIKDNSPQNPYLVNEKDFQANGSFDGFECRWNEIPSAQDETITLMVQALPTQEEEYNQIYAGVLRKITEIYGHEVEHHPLLEENLSLTLSPMKLAPEAMIRTTFQGMGKMMSYLLKIWFSTAAGKFLMKNQVKTKAVDWGRYKKQLIANTDYRKFDTTLRMIISGTSKQRVALAAFLKASFEKGELIYGIHASENALITCVVVNYDTEHVHFLDGGNGGYAAAAKAMKQQLQSLNV